MQSKAHIKAVAKFNKDNYKQLKANVKPADYDVISEYCETKGISKAQFIVRACKYCIENNIDLTDSSKDITD